MQLIPWAIRYPNTKEHQQLIPSLGPIRDRNIKDHEQLLSWRRTPFSLISNSKSGLISNSICRPHLFTYLAAQYNSTPPFGVLSVPHLGTMGEWGVGRVRLRTVIAGVLCCDLENKTLARHKHVNTVDKLIDNCMQQYITLKSAYGHFCLYLKGIFSFASYLQPTTCSSCCS